MNKVTATLQKRIGSSKYLRDRLHIDLYDNQMKKGLWSAANLDYCMCTALSICSMLFLFVHFYQNLKFEKSWISLFPSSMFCSHVRLCFKYILYFWCSTRQEWIIVDSLKLVELKQADVVTSSTIVSECKMVQSHSYTTPLSSHPQFSA